MKRALRKHAASVRRGGKKRSLKHQLANCLFQFRNTPHSVTGVTPSELFLKCKPRTKFSILLPNMEEHILNQQVRQQRQHDKSHVKLPELSPHDSVNVPNTWGGMEEWVPGTVIRRLGPLRRRSNTRNVSFRISLRWLTYIVNSVDKTKLSGGSWSPIALCSH